MKKKKNFKKKKKKNKKNGKKKKNENYLVAISLYLSASILATITYYFVK